MFHRFTTLSRVHFVGIGGAGMSGIAEVLADDLEVSGCDLAPSETTRRLQGLGIRVEEGHSPAHLADAELVVVSSAVGEGNPEIAAARERGIPVVRRAEMLAELMRLKYGIAVAGTHGKTTTTSLVGTLLTEAGLDPTVIVGGRLRLSGTGARLGKSDYLVAEADEFDRSFLRLQPVLGVVTSIDVDHLDTYADLGDIQEAFVTFAGKVPFFGQVIVCLDDPRIQEILPRLADRRVVTYGLSPQAELSAHDVATQPERTRFRVRHAQRGELGTVELPLPGIHNVQNALAAVGVGLAMGLDFPAIAAGLSAFRGVHRRFERLGEFQGAVVVDDYAHHPTEVTATLEAARQAFPGAALHAVFQPHLYSRTRDLAGEFGRSLLAADHAWITDIYPSRERPLPGVTAELVLRAARESGHRQVALVGDWRELPPRLAGEVAAGDVILTLGAGDIYRLALELVGGGGLEMGSPRLDRARERWKAAQGRPAARRSAAPAPGLPAAAATDSYRRRRVERHRRRGLLPRLLGPLAGAALVVGAPAALAAWVATSPKFVLRELEIEGTRRVEEAWMAEALAPLRGRHLLWLPLGEVKVLLARHPWIGAVEIEKRLPGRLHLRVTEREPRALVRRGDELHYVDAAGLVIAPFDPRRGPHDLLLLTAVRSPDELVEALETAVELDRRFPRWSAALSEMEALGGGDYRLYTGLLPVPVLVSRRHLEAGIGSLERWLPRIDRRVPRPAEIDLRYRGQIVVRPQAGEGEPT